VRSAALSYAVNTKSSADEVLGACGQHDPCPRIAARKRPQNVHHPGPPLVRVCVAEPCSSTRILLELSWTVQSEFRLPAPPSGVNNADAFSAGERGSRESPGCLACLAAVRCSCEGTWSVEMLTQLVCVVKKC
jgi:hypothetical protein